MTDWMSAWFAATSARFLRSHPFYAAVLARMTPAENPAVRVMGVAADGPRLQLHVNPDFFRRRKHRKFAVGVLHHEVHHVVLGHLTDPRFLGLPHPDLMELAMEVSANENVPSPLPGHPPRWERYAELGMRPGQSTLERYELLVRGREGGKEPPPGETADDHLPDGVGRVWNGKPPPKRPEPPPPPPPPPKSMFQKMLESLSRWANPHPAAEPTPPTATQPTTDPRPGTQPGNREVAIGAAGGAPDPLDWKAFLRLFRKSARTPQADYTRPSRRLPHLVGVVPGRTRRRGVEPLRLLVAIDTSSSMTQAELNRIGAELARLRRVVSSVRVVVVECDEKVQRVYPFRRQLQSVVGRGGTDLRPVFAAAVLKQHRPDGVVYFTDGEGAFPAEACRLPTLWVLTKAKPFACPWGVRAKL